MSGALKSTESKERESKSKAAGLDVEEGGEGEKADGKESVQDGRENGSVRRPPHVVTENEVLPQSMLLLICVVAFRISILQTSANLTLLDSRRRFFK